MSEFLDSLSRQSFIKLEDEEKLYTQVPDEILLFSKDSELNYKLGSKAFLATQGLNRSQQLKGIDDYNLPNRETYKSPESVRADDYTCLFGTRKSWQGTIYANIDGIPTLYRAGKLAIKNKGKSVGIIGFALNISETFLRERTLATRKKTASIYGRNMLTGKQLAVLRVYNQGYSRKTGAEMLNISESTYAWHLNCIREKFGIHTRTEMLTLERYFL